MTEHIKDDLIDLIYGELPARRQREVLDHLEACPECARERERIEHTLGMFRKLPDPEPSPFLNTRIMARVEESLRAKPWWRRVFAPSLATAAVAVIAVSVVSLMMKEKAQEKFPPPTKPAPAVAMKEKGAAPKLDLLASEFEEDAAPVSRMDMEAMKDLGDLAAAPSPPEPGETEGFEEQVKIAKLDDVLISESAPAGETAQADEPAKSELFEKTDAVHALYAFASEEAVLEEPPMAIARADQDQPDLEKTAAAPASPPPPASPLPAPEKKSAAPEPAVAGTGAVRGAKETETSRGGDEGRNKAASAPKSEEPAKSAAGKEARSRKSLAGPAASAPAPQDQSGVRDEKSKAREPSPGLVLVRADLVRAGRGCEAALPIYEQALRLLGYGSGEETPKPVECGRSLEGAVKGGAECYRETGNDKAAQELETWQMKNCPDR